ncbi:2Fe-2S iron-sulfur cluster-binding protein [Rossellomorea aquimaris]|uniref:2Fe-2S iron-sulfur cluster-binding protein n=1 Tax=Rossellomorea aquimaris TaxID=189382 RepID=UPI0005C8EF05|nr:2Fe-2S iron-sulfur cluster-binding protein [Rossellomorea aquimaris]
MPNVKLYVEGGIVEQDVKDGANLVVLAGIKQFPKLKYGCGMGKCTKCTCKVLSGGENLDPPNWKEDKMLGELVNENYRLTCQLNIKADIELTQEGVDVKKRRDAAEAKG